MDTDESKPESASVDSWQHDGCSYLHAGVIHVPPLLFSDISTSRKTEKRVSLLSSGHLLRTATYPKLGMLDCHCFERLKNASDLYIGECECVVHYLDEVLSGLQVPNSGCYSLRRVVFKAFHEIFVHCGMHIDELVGLSIQYDGT